MPPASASHDRQDTESDSVEVALTRATLPPRTPLSSTPIRSMARTISGRESFKASSGSWRSGKLMMVVFHHVTGFAPREGELRDPATIPLMGATMFL